MKLKMTPERIKNSRERRNMKTKSQQCIHCKKMFKRVKSHERFCPERLYTQQMTQQPEPLEFRRRDLDLAERVGYDKGSKETEQRLNGLVQGVKIKALDAAAKAVDAIAHMMGDM